MDTNDLDNTLKQFFMDNPFVTLVQVQNAVKKAQQAALGEVLPEYNPKKVAIKQEITEDFDEKRTAVTREVVQDQSTKEYSADENTENHAEAELNKYS